MLISEETWGQARFVMSALKPADWIILTYSVFTIPVLFCGGQVIVGGLLLRLFMFPVVIYGRHYFASTPRDRLPGKIREYSFFGNRLRFIFSPIILLSVALDFYGLISCFYYYSEDGVILSRMYPDNPHFILFWDDTLKVVDAEMFGVDPEIGVGEYLRSITSPVFNVIFGEYLNFCYFFFYFILVGTYLLAYFFCRREHFDRIASAELLTYSACLTWYLVQPAAGPYWTYGHTESREVGFFFSKLVHTIVDGGSSFGTAFPSGHCSLTTAAWIGTSLYLPHISFLYLFIAPGLWFATIWCGFHYAVDALLGIAIGAICGIVGISVTEALRYRLPQWDTVYSDDYLARREMFWQKERTHRTRTSATYIKLITSMP